jgi:anti-anti-sigma regulatory factor
MTTEHAHSLQLTGEMTLRQAGALQAQLRSEAAEHDHVVIDCADVSEIDISVVQLLVAASKSAEAAGKSVSVRFPEGGVLDTILRRAGFLSQSGQPLSAGNGPWQHDIG